MLINNSETQKYFFWISIFLILLFTFLQPAATSGAGFWVRLLIWTIQIGILVPSLIFIHIQLQRNHFFDQLNDWNKLLLSGFMGCFLFLPFALLIDYLMGLDDWSKINNIAQAQNIILNEIGGMFPPAMLTWAAINTPRILNLNFSNKSSSELVQSKAYVANAHEAREAPPLEKSEFFNKFSKSIGTEIIYMMSELHYVRVVTMTGEMLILHNLKDAISELPSEFTGIQTHRSFWVCLKYIDTIKEKRNRSVLMLSNGKSIPISRRRLGRVKELLDKNAA